MDRDNTGVIKRVGLDRRVKRERDRGGRLRKRWTVAEKQTMWERDNDSDTEIMKKREGMVHKKRWGRGKERK